MEITWLGHGTFQFKLPSGEVLLMDPWVEGNPAYPATHEITRADFILLTHAHFDHIHDAVSLAKKFSSKVVGIYETCQWLVTKGVTGSMPMNKGGSQQVGPVTVTMTNAEHSGGVSDNDQLLYGGEAAGYVVQLPDRRRFYFAGDTNVFLDMMLIARLYAPELVFLPIGGLFTMGPREAAEACRLLRPKKVIPMHFGTFPALTGSPDQLAQLIRDMEDITVWTLEPGKPVTW